MKFIHWLSLTLALLVFGCASENPSVPPGSPPTVESLNTTVVLDDELDGYVAVDQQKVERTRRGKLKASSNVRNRSNRDITLQVQTVFRDADGFSIEDDTAWETLILTAHETKTLTAISTSRKAARYTMRLRLQR